MPERLQGQWQHAMFTTYTMDLEFFEHQVWWPLPETCRNVFVLCDEERLLEACEREASRRLVTHLNRRYVVDGLRFPGAAHSKIVLLTDEKQGRLLIGSGNLGPKGWVRGGEIFTEYNYSEGAAEELPAFLAVRDLIMGLLEDARIEGLARERTELLLSETPWLYQGGEASPGRVHHNLLRTLLDQLIEAIGERPVEELSVLSPFYDPEAFALAQLLSEASPRTAEVYVEPGCTSVDPKRLAAVRDASNGTVVVRPFGRDGCDYVHAKAYLLKGTDFAVLLTGSPNLSRAAMLNTAAHGNLEVASILAAGRDAFDYVFDDLLIAPPEDDLSMLGLELDEMPEPEEGDLTLTLHRAVVRAATLELHVRGELPGLATLALLIGDSVHPLDQLEASDESGRISVPLDDAFRAELVGLQPLRLRWDRPGGAIDSNVVFPMDQAALAAEARSPQARAAVSAFAGVAIGDELAEVVMPLEIVLGDFRGAWRPAVKASNPTPSEEDEQRFILYKDVDIKALRQHPKIQQYLHSHRVHIGPDDEHWTVLDSVPASVAEFFRQFAKRDLMPSPWTDEDVIVGEDGVAVSAEEADEHKAHKLQEAQLRELAVKRFVANCVRGITSEGFREIAGFVFVSRVYAIFEHILLRFADERWVDLAFLADAAASIWEFYWGTANKPGLFFASSEAERQLALTLLKDHGGAQTLLAMLSAISVSCTDPPVPSSKPKSEAGGDEPDKVKLIDEEVWLRIRDVLHGLLLREPLTFDGDSVEAAVTLCSCLSLKGKVEPADTLGSLQTTECHDTASGFLAQLTDLLGPGAKGAGFDVEGCFRPAIGQNWTARCLVFISGQAIQTVERATQALRCWMRWQPQLQYYRLLSRPDETVQIAFYDRASESGAYLDRRGGGQSLKLGSLEPLEPAWQDGLEHLIDLFGLDEGAAHGG